MQEHSPIGLDSGSSLASSTGRHVGYDGNKRELKAMVSTSAGVQEREEMVVGGRERGAPGTGLYT